MNAMELPSDITPFRIADDAAKELLRKVFHGRTRAEVAALVSVTNKELKAEGLIKRTDPKCSFCDVLGHKRNQCRVLKSDWDDLSIDDKRIRIDGERREQTRWNPHLF